ncbi:MAG: xanthine dehydrogenase family protein subunit M [Chitinophagaceae bacterium]
MNNFNYLRPADLQEAVSELVKDTTTQVLAGGTNIIDLWKYDLTNFTSLVDINSLKEFSGIEELPDGGLRIGALMKNSDTAYHHLIEQNYPLLSKAILAGASAQIRNMASNGGNLLQRTRCYYFYDKDTACNKRNPGSGCSALTGHNRIMAILGTSESCIAVFPSDMCVALAALDAHVNLTGPNGPRSIDIRDFHRLPGDTPDKDNNLQQGEIITGIDLPQKCFSANYSYLKIRDRSSYAFALISVATAFILEDNMISEARIALGGVAHKPWRVVEAEDFLKQKSATPENFAAAADIILAGAKGYEHNTFKIPLAKKAIIRNCLMALTPESQLPGAKPSK